MVHSTWFFWVIGSSCCSHYLTLYCLFRRLVVDRTFTLHDSLATGVFTLHDSPSVDVADCSTWSPNNQQHFASKTHMRGVTGNAQMQGWFLSLQTGTCHFCIMFSKNKNKTSLWPCCCHCSVAALITSTFPASPHVYFHWLFVWLVINPTRHPVLISNSESDHRWDVTRFVAKQMTASPSFGDESKN